MASLLIYGFLLILSTILFLLEKVQELVLKAATKKRTMWKSTRRLLNRNVHILTYKVHIFGNVIQQGMVKVKQLIGYIVALKVTKILKAVKRKIINVFT